MESLVQEKKQALKSFKGAKPQLPRGLPMQLIILLSGVVMSIALFVLFGLYADRFTETDRQKINKDVQAFIDNRVQFAMQTIHIIALKENMEALGEEERDVIDPVFLDSVGVYESIYAVRETSGINLDWALLYGQDSAQDITAKLYVPVKSIFREIGKKSSTELIQTPVLSFVSDTKIDGIKLKQSGADHVVMIASPIGKQSNHLILGIASLSQIIGDRIIKNTSGLLRVSVIDRRLNELLYIMDKKPGWEPEAEQAYTYTLSIGNQQ